MRVSLVSEGTQPTSDRSLWRWLSVTGLIQRRSCIQYMGSCAYAHGRWLSGRWLSICCVLLSMWRGHGSLIGADVGKQWMKRSQMRRANVCHGRQLGGSSVQPHSPRGNALFSASFSAESSLRFVRCVLPNAQHWLQILRVGGASKRAINEGGVRASQLQRAAAAAAGPLGKLQLVHLHAANVGAAENGWMRSTGRPGPAAR